MQVQQRTYRNIKRNWVSSNYHPLRTTLFVVCKQFIADFHIFFSLPYDTFDILTDEDVRQGLKVLMNWPTFPQVYVDGEFIGGVDIIKSLKEDGELLSALKA